MRTGHAEARGSKRPLYRRPLGRARIKNERMAKVTGFKSGFLDERGELQPRFQSPPLIASFMQETAAPGERIPVPKGPVEVW